AWSGDRAMPAITVHIVNAFVRDGAGGNPAGVVLDADDLSEADMQKTAAAVGVSETAFVSRSSAAGFRLDFFTPNMRIAHCGHATIAAFSYLVSIGRSARGQPRKRPSTGRAGSSSETAFLTWSNAPRIMTTRQTGLLAAQANRTS